MGQVVNLAMFTMDRTVTQSVYRLPARLLSFVLTRSLARPPRGWAPPTFHQPASCRVIAETHFSVKSSAALVAFAVTSLPSSSYCLSVAVLSDVLSSLMIGKCLQCSCCMLAVRSGRAVYVILCMN